MVDAKWFLYSMSGKCERNVKNEKPMNHGRIVAVRNSVSEVESLMYSTPPKHCKETSDPKMKKV
jgi:hypothetical protein